MVLYRYWTGRDTIIIIWMYTSILGNKQSTINSYMYFFFFPFHIQKGLGWHKLSSSTIIELVHDSNFSSRRIDASYSWRTSREQTPMQSQKDTERKLRVNHWRSWVSIPLIGLIVCSCCSMLREAWRLSYFTSELQQAEQGYSQQEGYGATGQHRSPIHIMHRTRTCRRITQNLPHYQGQRGTVQNKSMLCFNMNCD